MSSDNLVPACPILELKGSPFERGRTHGAAARDLIAGLLGEHFAFLEYSAQHVVGFELNREKILRVTDQFLPACERFSPALVDEVRGIAAGSGLPFREVFSLNTFIDVADWVRPATAHNYSVGCTTFGACPPATREGQVVLGQTFDTKAAFEPFVVALRVESEGEPPAWVASFAGIVGCAGINAAGVGVVINHLNMADARPGVPFTFAVRECLRAPSAQAALNTLARSERASGIHYLVGDECDLGAVETSATRFERLTPREGWLAHANHCAAPELRAIEASRSNGSLQRGARAASVLAGRAGQIDAEVLGEIARDHTGEADTVCSHPELDAPRLRQYKTCFAVILEPEARAMTLLAGSPCEGRKMRLTV
ncbi:MAG: C45 family autoproteolytic acyltransferase/hydrolase [Anaerolineales bacterium]